MKRWEVLDLGIIERIFCWRDGWGGWVGWVF